MEIGKIFDKSAAYRDLSRSRCGQTEESLDSRMLELWNKAKDEIINQNIKIAGMKEDVFEYRLTDSEGTQIGTSLFVDKTGIHN